MLNAFTVDLEDWFHILPEQLKDKSHEVRIHHGTNQILELLNSKRVKGTFFVLGEVIERSPEILKAIVKEGHEIALHGFGHNHLSHSNRDKLYTELKRTIELVNEITNVGMRGYRAPHFSIGIDNHWALDVIAELGIKYDSSFFPISFHPDYGNNKLNHKIHLLANGIIEVPLSVTPILRYNFPLGGGAYFRHLPYSLFKKLARKINNSGEPLIFYIHPWELDVDQPKLGSSFRKFRNFRNIETVHQKLDKLLHDFQFSDLYSVIKEKGLL